MKLSKTTLLLLLSAGCIGLCYFIVLAMFTRPMIDDLYWMSGSGLKPAYGFEFNINGRITSLILYGILYVLPFSIQIIPIFTLLLVIVTLYFIVYRAISPYVKDIRLVSLTSAIFITLAIYLATPGLYTNLYWLSAAPVHVWSYCFVVLYLVFISSKYRIKMQPTWRSVALLFCLPLCISLIYETSTALLISGLFILCVVHFYKQRKMQARDYVPIFASLIGFLLLFFAPFATIRKRDSSFSHIEGIPHAIWHVYTDIAPSLYTRWSLIVLVFLVGFLVTAYFIKPQITKISIRIASFRIFTAILLSAIIPAVNIAIIWYGREIYPPIRSYFIMTICLLVTSFYIGFILAVAVKSMSKIWFVKVQAAMIVLFLFTLILFGASWVSYAYKVGQETKNFAYLWDNRNSQIKQLIADNKCDMTVPNLPIDGMGDIHIKPDNWTNTAITYYYFGAENPNRCRISASDEVHWFKVR